MAVAFAADMGGVITFDNAGAIIGSGDTLAATYGVSGLKTLNFLNTNSGGKQIGQNFSSTRTAISGGANSHLTAAGTSGNNTRNDFAFSVSSSSPFEVVDRIGVTVMSRSLQPGNARLTATLDDGSLVNTINQALSSGNGSNDTFFVVEAPAGRFIESFVVDLTGDSFFTAIDDLAFTTAVVPEPASAGLIAVAGLGLLGRRRRS